MEFRVLGPLQVVRDGVEITVGAAKQRTLLAVLAFHAGRAVPTEELIDRLWGAQPPPGARNTLRAYVMRLRKTLGDASLIETMPDGYRLVGGTTDVQRFEALISEARSAPADATLPRLDEALALWRGSPAEGLPPAEAQALAERRLDVFTRRCEVLVELGRHEEVIADLRDLVAQHPVHEHLWALLMKALHGSGRRAEALAAYEEARKVLSEQLGVDPGGLLRALRAEVASTEAPPSARPVFQLPPAVGNFVGRTPELARIRRELTPESTTRIMIISGPPGVGKTALAVRSAHALRDEFPDGQLFVNLRGHAQSSPVHPADALSRFLRALGVKPEEIPIDEDELAARFRSELADRRILIVLDNALSLSQVQPLLPGSASCAVVITSRNRLRSLVASHGAATLPLDVLTTTDSTELIERSLGPQTRQMAATLAELCSYLPLALRIAIANMTNMSASEAENYLTDLMHGRQLTSLHIADDQDLALRTTFDLSYRVLTPAAQRLFRLLAAVPGPDFTVGAASALAAVDAAEAHRLLAELQSASLTHSVTAGRWQLHDLLKLYAQELLAETADAEPARLRLFGWYLHTADAAVALVAQQMIRGAIDPLPDSVDLPVLPDTKAALDWLGSEHHNLVAAGVHAAEHGPRRFSWQLANVLRGYLRSRGHRVDWLTLSETGMRVAIDEGDAIAQALMHNCLGTIYEVTDNEKSIHHFEQAIAVGGDDIEPNLRAAAMNNLGTQYKEIGRVSDAIAMYERALAVARQSCPPITVAIIMGNLGTAYLMGGHLVEARECFTRASEHCFSVGHDEGAAINVANLAIVALELGDIPVCLEHAATAQAIFERHEYGYGTAGILSVIANARLELGELDTALAIGARGVELARSANATRYESDAFTVLSAISNARGDVDGALDQARSALKIAMEVKQVRSEIEARVALAAAHQADGEWKDAEEHARHALSMAEQASVGQRIPRCHLTLATVLAASGRRAEAVPYAEQAVRIAADHGQAIDQARALIVLADSYSDDRSADCLRQALAVYENIGHPGADRVRALLSPRER